MDMEWVMVDMDDMEDMVEVDPESDDDMSIMAWWLGGLVVYKVEKVRSCLVGYVCR